MSNLTTDDMVVVAEVFQGAYEHVLGNYIGESKDVVLAFVVDVILRQKPYMLVSEEGLNHAIAMVFGTETHRDFILMLTFTFFARWGNTDQQVVGLAANVARGVSLAGRTDMNAVPAHIRTRLPDSTDARVVLEANQWLVVLLMLQLFITASPADTRQPE